MLFISLTLIQNLVPIYAFSLQTLVLLVNIQAVFLIVKLALHPCFSLIDISINSLTLLLNLLLCHFSHLIDLVHFREILFFELLFKLL